MKNLFQILQDFNLFHPGKIENFDKFWHQLTFAIHEVYVEDKKTEIVDHSDWPEEIKNYIKLLQLLPASPNTYLDSRNDMYETISAFIVWSEVIMIFFIF